MTRARTDGRAGAGRDYRRWLAADVALVVLFALLGRLSHYGTLSLLGLLGTALPFLLAYLVAATAVVAWRRPIASPGTATLLWVGTAVGGLALRVFFGEGAALPFQIVTVAVLGVFLVIPRVIAFLVPKRRRARRQPSVPYSPSHNQGEAA